jgi:hypothetical protein
LFFRHGRVSRRGRGGQLRANRRLFLSWRRVGSWTISRFTLIAGEEQSVEKNANNDSDKTADRAGDPGVRCLSRLRLVQSYANHFGVIHQDRAILIAKCLSIIELFLTLRA